MSPKPRTTDEDADLQIPRRDPREVPDAQIILMDELDRGFVAWVEGEMRARGIRTEVMLLSPRISLPAVIRRQILEGVLAVAQLTRRSQDTSKIPLQVFDRTGGANNVRFDEYQDLEPKIAAELVLRAKQTQAPPVPTTYAQPQLAPQQTYQPPTTTAAAPNLANLVGQLDNATLQKLLGTLNAVAPAPQVPQPANPPLDLAGILGWTCAQQQQQPTTAQQRNAYQSQARAPNSYASLPIMIIWHLSLAVCQHRPNLRGNPLSRSKTSWLNWPSSGSDIQDSCILHGLLSVGVRTFHSQALVEFAWSYIRKSCICILYIRLGVNASRCSCPSSTGSISMGSSPERHHMLCVTSALLYSTIHRVQTECQE